MPKWYMVLELVSIEGQKPIKEGVYILKEGKPDLVFYDEGQANRHAEKLASQKPGKLVLIFKAVEALEADKAPINKKIFSDNGELLPR